MTASNSKGPILVCGIVGILSLGARSFPISDYLSEMSDTLVHRGPDESGSWIDTSAGIALAHRRLSIVELSNLGGQPMNSQDGRFHLVYNGEIYNHLELRRKLHSQGHRVAWRGNSDSETLLECWTRWGGRETLVQLNGMFAAAIWDSNLKKLTLVRDRFGEKPLYYGLDRGVVVFASQLSAFKRLPDFDMNLSEKSLRAYLRYGYVPNPYSIYEKVLKLTPGTFLEITLGLDTSVSLGAPQTYWSAIDVAKAKIAERNALSNDEEIEYELNRVLGSAVRAQMMGDVPLGAFLSGGIDSSLIVALMQEHSSNPVKTFSIGSNDVGYDEAVYANQVAHHLGTDHTELYLSENDVLSLIPRLPLIYDEPFADSSQIPTFFVSKLARRSVKVSLSGDGGDELFGGYARYFQVAARWHGLRLIPLRARRAVSQMIGGMSLTSLNPLLDFVTGFYQAKSLALTRPGEKAHKVAQFLPFENSRDLYERIVSVVDPSTLMAPGSEHQFEFADGWPLDSQLIDQMMMLDTLTYLRDDILVKVDRAAMANSLETRAPFLDHRVFEFAWSLDETAKIGFGESKRILRRLLARHVPPALTNRPKMGFGVPIGDWLRTFLREWAGDLLSKTSTESEGFFRFQEIDHIWRQHLSGVRNNQFPLWNILMFQAWRIENSSETISCDAI